MCDCHTRSVFFTKLFSIPDLLTAVPPGEFHSIRYDIKEVLVEFANSRRNGCCPQLSEVSMRVRFLWTPQNWNQVQAYVHFIDEIWYGTPGGTLFPASVVGAHAYLAHRNTTLDQPFETLMTKFPGDLTSNSYAITVYFKDFEGFQLPMSSEQLHVALDFKISYV